MRKIENETASLNGGCIVCGKKTKSGFKVNQCKCISCEECQKTAWRFFGWLLMGEDIEFAEKKVFNS